MTAHEDRGADLSSMLAHVRSRGGSDLHISAGLPPMIRLQGRLIRTDAEPMTAQETKESIYAILTQDQREVLERTQELDFAHSVPGSGWFRANAYFQRGTVGAAFRAIPTRPSSFSELGLPPIVESMAQKPRGLVLVTGATGSGKSTTLTSVIDFINAHRCVHIMTVEDPIEYRHEHRLSMVNQREIGSDTQTFEQALKYALRQDPDVLMIGEMRDLETIRAALTAAETGHLVFATLHTQDATQTVDRIVDVFPPHQQHQVRFQLSACLQGIISQQLLPTMGEVARVLATEVLVPTPAVRNLIREAKTHLLASAMQTGRQHGMRTMDGSLAELCRNGAIAYDTAMTQASDPTVLKALLARTGT